MPRTVFRYYSVVILLLFVTGVFVPGMSVGAQVHVALKHDQSFSVAGNPDPGTVQSFLDSQPGVLKQFHDGPRSAAHIIESYAAYYSLNPHILLTLLELGPGLLSEPHPAQTILDRPFGSLGPAGFTAQIDWATREVRAGFGPYSKDPVVTFVDGSTTTISRQQEPSVVAVQRFLALGHTQTEWRGFVDRYAPLFKHYFGDEPMAPTPTATPKATQGFLGLPWPAGTRMIHAAYFDHVYPTVDKGSDGNNFIVTYLGTSNVSYNTHDGHDFYFPDKPIGTPILAAAPGIAYAFSTPGNGVVVRHGGQYAGYETVYWHLDQFDVKFQGKIDNQIGVPVQAGEVLGVSGKSGFTDGGAHLHFEVRHNGLEVDPYGWYGGGSDPCAAWTAGCEASVWLWSDSLRGTYDFTPPNSPAVPDIDPPTGTLSVVQQPELSLLVHFDGHPVPSIGMGFPEITAADGAALHYSDGVFGKAVTVPAGVNLTYPITGNVDLNAGTIALWANVPQSFPTNGTNRHYLFAASENPGDSAHNIYTNTLTLRHQVNQNVPEWNFWTVDAAGLRHDLVVTDTLQPGWHHFAVTWDKPTGAKRLFIDGVLAGQATGVALPSGFGERLEVGRWTTGYGEAGIPMDELAVWKRALAHAELADLATRHDIDSPNVGAIGSAPAVPTRDVTLDTNAIDARGGIVSVQLKRDNEAWGDPLPYYDSYRWSITGTPGLHSFAVRYTDSANNSTEVTTIILLAEPPVGEARLTQSDASTGTFSLAVPNAVGPVMFQVGAIADLSDVAWEPLVPSKTWTWTPGAPQIAYLRFRDANGLIGSTLLLGPDMHQIFVPLLNR
ncbi:MAG: peptidoglycan DD-metalloendopeptidase family protein [Herpetosiphonaceae bacterium]|nr:peptidoglycan DD-metalloendopeptidase family protein [Herpetosiphonaceae bacterium]